MGQGVQGLAELPDRKIGSLFLAYRLFEFEALHEYLELLVRGGRFDPMLSVVFGDTGQMSLNRKEAARASQEGDVLDQRYRRKGYWFILVLLAPGPVLAKIRGISPVGIGRPLKSSLQVLAGFLVNCLIHLKQARWLPGGTSRKGSRIGFRLAHEQERENGNVGPAIDKRFCQQGDILPKIGLLAISKGYHD